MTTENILIIDIGNTRVKAVVVDHKSEALDSYIDQTINPIIMEHLIGRHPALGGVMICSSRGEKELQASDLQAWLRTRIEGPIMKLDHRTPVPLINRYQTPATLGMDRLAAAVGAASIAPDEDLLVVDFGTAITIDQVSRHGEFLGGTISPGMSMRFNALHTMTASLPQCNAGELDPTENLSTVGRSTYEAMALGVVRGIEFEIEGYVRESGCKKVFFTGGDAFYFAERVKCTIFANYDLVMIGLNRIFRYNAQTSSR